MLFKDKTPHPRNKKIFQKKKKKMQSSFFKKTGNKSTNMSEKIFIFDLSREVTMGNTL